MSRTKTEIAICIALFIAAVTGFCAPFAWMLRLVAWIKFGSPELP